MITTLLDLVGNLVQEYKTHGTSIFLNATSVPQFNQLVEQLSKIDLHHVGIDSDNPHEYFKKDCTHYFNILEEQDFSVGVFCLGKGSSLDLHDHPNMMVLSKYLMGSVHYRALDLVDRPQQISLPKLLYQDESTEMVGMKLEATVRCEKVLRTGEISYLTPERGNIHKITALENTAFLDILLPNYNEVDRYCNYYTELYEEEIMEENKIEEELNFNGKMQLDQEQKTECLEVKIKQTNTTLFGQRTNNNNPVQKKQKIKQPGGKTTLLYALPSFEQPINLLPYKGEEFNFGANRQD